MGMPGVIYKFVALDGCLCGALAIDFEPQDADGIQAGARA